MKIYIQIALYYSCFALGFFCKDDGQEKFQNQQNINDCANACKSKDVAHTIISFCGNEPCPDGQQGSCLCNTEISCFTATATGGWVMYKIPGNFSCILYLENDICGSFIK